MKNKVHIVFITVFSLILFTPIMLTILGIKVKPIDKNEKKISLNFKRNFPLKSDLFKTYSYFKTEVLEQNIFPRSVIEVENDWLFLGNKFGDVILESKAVIVFSKAEILKLKQNLLKKQAWYKKQNIPLYISVAPNKHTFYNGMIPVEKRNRNTKFEQLDSLCKTIDIKLINLGNNFHLEKKYHLYNKTDSHWNHLGGYYAFLSTMQAISKDFQKHNFSIYQPEDIEVIRYQRKVLGDLNRAIELYEYENFIDIKLKDTTRVRFRKVEKELAVPEGFYWNPAFYEKRRKSNTNNLKGLFLRDSFFGAYHKLISDNFGETLLIWWHSFDPELIKKEKPDFVCYEIVERNLDILLDDNLTHSPD